MDAWNEVRVAVGFLTRFCDVEQDQLEVSLGDFSFDQKAEFRGFHEKKAAFSDSLSISSVIILTSLDARSLSELAFAVGSPLE